MEKIELEAKERTETGRRVISVRRRGSIPAVVYGKGMNSLSLEVDSKVFKKAISGEAGTNVLITLKMDKGKSLPVITHDIQKNPLNDDILHVDFHKIQMNKALKTKVHLEIQGVAVGVKEEGGILVHPMREVEIECLPSDIPDKIIIDVSKLKINDSIHISDLSPPKGVAFLTAATELVASVSPPTKEEEVAPPTPEEGAVEGAEGAVPAAEGAEGEKPAAEKAAAPEGKGAAAKEKAPEKSPKEAKK
jgi:large subunit ribosomal protein L25